MKALIISIISIAVVIAGWGIFVSYSDKTIHEMMDTIGKEILTDVSAGNWDRADKQFDDLADKWHKQKKVYTFFFNTREINDTDYSIARAKYYIKAKDPALSSGELNCVKEQLKFLHQNELITLDNLF